MEWLKQEVKEVAKECGVCVYKKYMKIVSFNNLYIYVYDKKNNTTYKVFRSAKYIAFVD